MGRKNNKTQGAPVPELELRAQKHCFTTLIDGTVHRVKLVEEVPPDQWRVRVKDGKLVYFVVVAADKLAATKEQAESKHTTSIAFTEKEFAGVLSPAEEPSEVFRTLALAQEHLASRPSLIAPSELSDTRLLSAPLLRSSHRVTIAEVTPRGPSPRLRNPAVEKAGLSIYVYRHLGEKPEEAWGWNPPQ